MADPRTLADQASQDGQGAPEEDGARSRAKVGASGDGRGRLGAITSLAGAAGRVAGAAAGAAGPLADGVQQAAGRVGDELRERLTADLDDRDPDYLRENMPLLWLISSIWFRGEVRNLGNVPEDGPVLMVGNHSGGNVTPDTFVFSLAFSTYFGVERRFHQLAHSMVMALPYGNPLRKGGTVAASHENARQALEAGSALLVYPGGDWEVHRPSWRRHQIDFAGRKGFLRLALDAGVPIVPVVSVGGQETALFLSQGSWIARGLGLDRLLRLKVMPISIALPWGVNVGDFLGHIPLPAKITIEVLPPIDLREQFGPEPDLDEAYRYVTRVMQDTLDALAAERRFLMIG